MTFLKKLPLETILNHIEYGITIQNTKGNLLFANKAAVRIIGLGSRKDVLKTSSGTIMKRLTLQDEAGKTLPVEKLPGRMAIKSRRSFEMIVKYIENLTGKTKYSIVKASPFISKKEEVEFVINTFEDITQRRNEEERREQFIAIAGHEIKTPLSNVKAYSQLMSLQLKKGKFGKAIPFANKINAKADELTKIINDFLDITKIRAGLLKLQLEVFDFDEFVKEVIGDMQSFIQSHKIILKGKVRSNIRADKIRLGQVISNLIRNARKYSPDADKIIVMVENKSKHLFISVQDFGIGIDYDDQEKIFEPFFRAKNNVKKQIQGLGLGLHISKELIHLHKGKMWLKSRPKKGSTFYLSFPSLTFDCGCSSCFSWISLQH